MIERKEYLSMLIENKDRDIIKVVTGVRRCGKSTLFALYIDWLRENRIAPDQIISVNLEALEYEALNDYHALYAYIKERLARIGRAMYSSTRCRTARALRKPWTACSSSLM